MAQETLSQVQDIETAINSSEHVRQEVLSLQQQTDGMITNINNITKRVRKIARFLTLNERCTSLELRWRGAIVVLPSWFSKREAKTRPFFASRFSLCSHDVDILMAYTLRFVGSICRPDSIGASLEASHFHESAVIRVSKRVPMLSGQPIGPTNRSV